ncbi:ABC transporter ATP-binding protein [Gracilibacillus salinarum]|uniref:ABC transporter ATP-binding protein n=1 Tax=Gracilibacillus salinarum TaxID=2932255 RepID=A0ABY4GLS4_9BACI|nr:ABC transporter ATP-binding protein [Gracilibacillus salinarum]UOQ84692.1 ABC transporter ATP-binding protein [Gracilibacillus salinarum]
MTTIIEDLLKKFDQTTALQNINISIQDGEFIAILGPSGCGKTTLLRLLAGFDSPSDGSITIGDQQVSTKYVTLPPEKRNIGMVFQSFALWPHLNVRKHIEFPLLHHQYVPADIRANTAKRVDEVMKIIELTELANRMPNELSGGQKQRVALGRAIAPKPELLLMDEPLSNLDAELRMEMRKEIQELHHLTNATIVYVTHDQAEALAMADRIVVMNKGKIEQIGTPQEIYSRPTTAFVANFVGKANLIQGTWESDQFTPASYPAITWPDLGVSIPLKKQGIYPIRPEQLEIVKDQQGIEGEITSVQYQGKEIHYTVQADGMDWVVHSGMMEKFRLGERIVLQLKVAVKEEQKEVVYS